MIPSVELKSGFLMPQIGLGTWKLTDSDCVKSVKNAIDVGYVHIDTAKVYGNQKEISKSIKAKNREELYITSKVWQFDLEDNSVWDLTINILEELNTTYLDQLLLHWPNQNLDHDKIIEDMGKLIDDGLVKSIGVSNFTINHLKKLKKKNLALISTNQIEFHPALYQKELLDFCEENGIKVVAYSPIGQAKIFNDILFDELELKYNKTRAQICLRWCIQKGVIVIPKASSIKHLKENIDIFDWNISQEDELLLDGLGNKLRLVNPSFAEFD